MEMVDTQYNIFNNMEKKQNILLEQGTDPRSKKKTTTNQKPGTNYTGNRKSGGQVWSDSPFKDKISGDKFRVWVNTTYPTVAKAVNLSMTGSYNNSYMKKSWEYPTTTGGKLGDEYLKTADGQALGLTGGQPSPSAEDLSMWNDKAYWTSQTNTKCLLSLGSNSVFSISKKGVSTPMLGVNTTQGQTYYFDMKGGVFNNKGQSLGLSYSCDGDKVNFFQAGTNESGLSFNTTSFPKLFGQQGTVQGQPSPTATTETNVGNGIEALDAASFSVAEAIRA